MSHVADVLAGLEAIRAPLEELYRDLHAHPELGNREERTAGIVADRLGAAGYAVHRLGGGVVGILANGEGPAVLERADMDALPVTEATGLDYASTRTAVDETGATVGVSHACGHDMHVASLLGAVELLAGARDRWRGTHIAVFQPAEELGSGAQGMVDAGLADVVGRPDAAFGQHVLGLEAGTVGTTAGPVLSAADSIRITVFGKGSHGSMPHLSVDPVVLAAAVVLRLQSVVSRETAPGDFAVVTVGSVAAGTKSNIIPDRAVLLLNVRTYDAEVRRRVLAGIERVVGGECEAAGSPAPPTFDYYDQYPLTTNDAALTGEVTTAFRDALGADRVVDLGRITASEDFSRIPDALGTPYSYWGIGGFAPGTQAPPNHSPLFAPLLQPTLDTGVSALVAAALSVLDRP